MTRSPAPPTDTPIRAVDVSPAGLEPLIEAGRHLALSELSGKTRELNAAPAALELLTEVVHDLRSPLSSMLVLIGQLQSGRAGPLTRQQELQLGILYEAAFEVNNLTRNALELARRSDVSPPAEVPMVFSVTGTWHTVHALLAPIAQERGLVLRWSGPRTDLRMGHPEILQKVLLNLVTNALKFTIRGTISVTVEELDEARVRFRVSDTGTGLNEPARAMIGEPPGQEQLPFSRNGRTLGLAICRRALADLNSRLELGHQQGPGTCLEFELRLPAAT